METPGMHPARTKKKKKKVHPERNAGAADDPARDAGVHPRRIDYRPVLEPTGAPFFGGTCGSSLFQFLGVAGDGAAVAPGPDATVLQAGGGAAAAAGV